MNSIATLKAPPRIGQSAAALVFLAGLLLFLIRGPWRAIQNDGSGDFAVAYAAARSWIQGGNPYHDAALADEFLRAGGSPALVPDASRTSLYLPGTMPLVGAVAWLSWPRARAVWCLLSLALFAGSLVLFLGDAKLPKHRLLLWSGAILLFSPAHTGIALGNPSVLACSLIALSLYFTLGGRWLAGGILLGLGLCVKPQLAVCGLAALALWKAGKPLLASLATFGLALALATAWQASYAGGRIEWPVQNISTFFAAGGAGDPALASPISYQLVNTQTLSALFIPDRLASDLLVLSAVGLLAAIYLVLRLRSPGWSWSDDLAMMAPLTLMATYHRYYDAQLLLLLVPFLLQRDWPRERKFILGMLLCLALLAFPSQAFAARHFPSPLAYHSAWEALRVLVLFRHQPIALAALALILSAHFRRRYSGAGSQQAVASVGEAAA